MGGAERRLIEELYERHAGAVFRYALRRSDRETAEEVTAQVFLVAWRRRGALPEDPLPWLYGVARRALADERRGASRRLRLGMRLRSTAVAPDPTHALPDRGLAEALGRLSERDREVLLLRYWEELEPAQIAGVTGRSKTATAVRLHRARNRLRRELDAEGGEDLKGREGARSCAVKAES
ncbi:MAG TPA: sigma-70 family RNA polymerase sigma factor [Solirubrobacteraceae bacterium]|nr:sigma-70 family RNA polymerase sigma factor [Solirubrobacteraceae bacterium]